MGENLLPTYHDFLKVEESNQPVRSDCEKVLRKYTIKGIYRWFIETGRTEARASK